MTFTANTQTNQAVTQLFDEIGLNSHSYEFIQSPFFKGVRKILTQHLRERKHQNQHLQKGIAISLSEIKKLNKKDLVAYSKAEFDETLTEVADFGVTSSNLIYLRDIFPILKSGKLSDTDQFQNLIDDYVCFAVEQESYTPLSFYKVLATSKNFDDFYERLDEQTLQDYCNFRLHLLSTIAMYFSEYNADLATLKENGYWGAYQRAKALDSVTDNA